MWQGTVKVVLALNDVGAAVIEIVTQVDAEVRASREELIASLL